MGGIIKFRLGTIRLDWVGWPGLIPILEYQNIIILFTIILLFTHYKTWEREYTYIKDLCVLFSYKSILWYSSFVKKYELWCTTCYDKYPWFLFFLSYLIRCCTDSILYKALLMLIFLLFDCTMSKLSVFIFTLSCLGK